ncbi:dihydrofolate reductase family protein [Actinocorallia longicatena]|uniref:Dihydrofolate reductase family protein n=1 Tax=Actinocorallia longicatena TaxID=111803 RepID=A0ABP6QKP5_9ACTN
MRKIIHWVHTSVDGFVSGPGGAFDWASLGPELADYSEALLERADTLLYGRVVWEMMAAHWPEADKRSSDEHSRKFAPAWRSMPKIVFSNTLEKDEWADRIIGGDIAAAVREIKAQPGRDLLLTGGSGLAASLTEHGLIDEYHIAVHPVVLGGGTPLFARGIARIPLRLVATRGCDGVRAVQHYERADQS